jgi:endonuclease/exonuclease/phosphatase family metal-dependent hydrolase
VDLLARQPFVRPWLPLIVSAIGLACAPAPSEAAQPNDLKVMSFNIRTGNADQGTVNAWDNRKDLVAQTIGDFGPDLFGLQEALRYQWKYLEGEFPGYQEVGRSVNDDGTGEYACLFYKKARFTEVAKGNFWLNPTNTPGETGWDATLPRVATWVKLQDKQNPGLTFVYLNTHLEHGRGDEARRNSASLIRGMIERLAPDGMPVIVSGDFNADQGSAAYQIMMGIDNSDPFRDYHDTYRQIHPEDSATVGTSLGFDGVGNNDGRIDWILQDGFTTLDATIDRVSYNGQFPSDHFPITATLTVVPEPTGLTLLGLGASGLLIARRRTPIA